MATEAPETVAEGLDGEDLAEAIFAELQTQVLNNPVPPKDAPEGLQRLASAIGKAVVDYLVANAQVHVKVDAFGTDVTGTLK
jgi:hypothetical protein